MYKILYIWFYSKKRMILKYVIINLFLFYSALSLNASNDLEKLIEKLKFEMQKREYYDSIKISKINNLKELTLENKITFKNKYFLNSKLIDEYEKYSFDSTLYYIEKNITIAKELKEPYFEKESKLKLALLLEQTGRYKESIDVLNEMNRFNLPHQLLRDYYYIYKEGYSGLAFYTTVTKSKEYYRNLYEKYQDSLSQKISLDSDEYLALIEKDYRDKRDIEKALKINSERLLKVKIGSPRYSLIAFERALLYDLKNDVDEQKKYLILSAISDIKASVKDNASLTDLAMIFFKEGKIDLAHNFISFSFEDTELYNSRLRLVNISNKLSVISKAYEGRNLLQKSKLKNSLLFISILVLFLLITIYFIYKQVKKLSQARKKLNKANTKLQELNEKLGYANSDLNRLIKELSKTDKIKEQYIGTFLNLYSDYIDKLDIYRKTVRKYIITNKINDLLEQTKSKKIIDEELKLFYENFDKSFLHIYPNFIENFNKLLKEDYQISVKKSNSLNVELRIFALIRLGLSSSSKISKILRYSVNTIYNYRVKIRNSAINRDNFEEMVKKIP